MLNKRTVRRLTIAALISISGIVATSAWRDSVSSSTAYFDATKSIAYILESRNEVQRKRASRALWQGIETASELGAGDSIRTGPNGGARIEFLASKTIIDIDPDSLVKIEENNGKLELDFVKGNLFVKSVEGQTPGSGLTLKSGEKTIALDGAELALGKDEKGSLALQVFKGTVEGVEKSRIEVLAPSPIEPIYISPSDSVSFRWKFENPDGYSVSLEMGKTSNDLKKAETVDPVQASLGTLSAKVGVGVQYWRLVATSSDASKPVVATRPIKLVTRPLAAPLLVQPSANSQVRLKPTNMKLRFRWVNSAKLPNLRFELANDGAGTDLIASEDLAGDTTEMEVELKDGGSYYWRVSGLLREKVAVTGVFSKFTIDNTPDLPQPKLLAPLANQRLPFEFVKSNGVFLRWDATPGATKYKVSVKAAGQNENFETDANLYRLKSFDRGDYEWSVSAIDDAGVASPVSETRKFKIEDVAKIDWTLLNPEDVFQYVTSTPTYSLEWKTEGLSSVSSWRVRVVRDGESLSEAEPVKSEKNRVALSADREGKFLAEVEGLNADGYVVAKSDRRYFSVRQLPLPGAPIFSGKEELIKANRAGDVDLSWSQADRAKTYFIRVIDATGEQVRLTEVPSNQSRVKRLMPGNYTVTVVASDAYGRRGPASEPRKLEVPATNNLKAPKLKKIKIK